MNLSTRQTPIALSHNTAILLLFATATLWSLGGVLIKLVQWHPFAIAGMRSAIAALFLILLKGNLKFTWSKGLMAGAIAYAATVVLFVAATKLTTAANAILLQYTAPVYVAIFSAWFLKEKVHFADWLSIVFVFCGLTLFFIDKIDNTGITGNIYAILSGFSFGWLMLILRRFKNTSQLDAIIIGNIIAALIGMPFMFQSMPDTNSWIGLIALGIVQLGLSYYLYSIAIKKVKAIEAIIILMIEPILNPIWVVLFIGEKPGLWALIGGIIVVSAITLRGMVGEKEKI